MAVRIPIIVDYNGKGLKKLKAEFAQLDGAAAKTKFALQKSLVPATAALAGLATVGTDAVQAALEDQKAQQILAEALRSTTQATDEQIDSVEKWISTQTMASAFTDDELRPAFAKLIRVTKDTKTAQERLSLAQDISRATGHDLSRVTDALAKSFTQNHTAILKIAPQLREFIKSGADGEEVFAALNEQFAGASATYVGTAAGRFELLKIRLDELKEAFGARLLPILEKKVLPALEKFAAWAEKNPDVIVGIAAAIGILTAGIVGLNVAMMANPYIIAAAGLAGLLVWLERTTHWVERLLKAWNSLKDAFSLNAPGTSGVLDRIQTSINQSRVAGVVPQNYAAQDTRDRPNINVNVNGGDPRAVVDAVVRWSRQNGRLPPQIQTAQ